eukprot:3284012-Pleurochrysis_carterae.AAC.1
MYARTRGTHAHARQPSARTHKHRNSSLKFGTSANACRMRTNAQTQTKARKLILCAAACARLRTCTDARGHRRQKADAGNTAIAAIGREASTCSCETASACHSAARTKWNA